MIANTTRGTLLSLLLFATLAVAACSDSAPPSPSGLFGGVWIGTLADSVSGNGAARVELAQNGAGVTGTFTWTFSAGTQRSGSASGTVAGSNGTLFFTPATGLICSSSLTLTGTMAANVVVSGPKMNASYSAFTCGDSLQTGTFELTRQ